MSTSAALRGVDRRAPEYGRRVRLYHQVRTAHLERAAELPPAVILFANKRYDFAAELAGDLDLVHARGWRAASWLRKHPPAVLEINEPLMLPAARSTATALLGLALARLSGAPRTRVVSYAIENLDPTRVPTAGRRNALVRRLEFLLAQLIWRRVDRIAYGTAAARRLYADLLPAKDAGAQKLILALPRPADASPDGWSAAKAPGTVLFLGAFSDRKGFSLVTQAWPQVTAELPDASLKLIGKGALQAQAEALATTDPRVSCLLDPPRDVIKTALGHSSVLVLPSQPRPNWREQVGLPIVEGLSHGCTVVTTAETGLAGWLAGHGHQVLSSDADADALAAAIIAALREPAPDVLASLPEVDGRLAADEWMFR